MRAFMMLCLFTPALLFANQDGVTAKGFHWYSIEKEEKEHRTIENRSKPTIKSQEPYEELLSLRRQNLNKLAESLLHPSVESTKSYIEAQTEMAKRHQAFVRNWQRVLLANPELDHRLNYPTDNNALAVKNDEEKLLTEEILKSSKNHFGLIFIYSGNTPISQKFSHVFAPFVDKYQFSVIPVSVTDESLPAFPDTRHISIDVLNQKIPLKKQYLPAVFLVNLKSKELSPLSYGYVALTDLKIRFLDVVTDFKRYSYEGLT